MWFVILSWPFFCGLELPCLEFYCLLWSCVTLYVVLLRLFLRRTVLPFFRVIISPNKGLVSISLQKIKCLTQEKTKVKGQTSNLVMHTSTSFKNSVSKYDLTDFTPSNLQDLQRVVIKTQDIMCTSLTLKIQI